jgi:adenylate kinase family enzyme
MQSIDAVTQQVEQHLESLAIFPKTAKADRPKAIVVLGNSGSGKTSQSRNICEKYGFVNISVGDLLREEISKAGRHAELFSEVMKQGKLVPSDLVVKLMKGVVEKHEWKGVFVLDGFPRNKDNLTKWNEELGVEIDLQFMLVLNCEQHTAEQRISRRSAGRVDDNPASVQMKVQTYLHETLPIIKEYTQQPDFVFPIDANPSEAEVFAQVKTVLEARGFKMQPTDL